MSEADSTTIAAAAKKRLRREARIRENYDRISATLSINDSKATKNPTRIIPDVPGFQALSKTEIKRDTKDIEKNSSFAHPKERNLIEEMDNKIQRSMRPHCAPDASLMRKKRRLVNWINNPDTVEKEMLHWQNTLVKAKGAHTQFEVEREAWLDSLQTARRLLVGALKAGTEQNRRMKADGAQLMSLCEAECGTALSRKKRSFQNKDLVDELLKRQGGYEAAMAEYVTLAQDLRQSGKTHVPTVSVAVEELHYAEDAVLIRASRGCAKKSAPRPEAPVPAVTAAPEKPAPDSAAPSTVTDAEADVKATLMSVKDEPMEVAVEGDASAVSRECITDIPLPYFDYETKQVLPASGSSSTELTAMASKDGAAAGASGPRTRKRSGSLTSIKLETSQCSASEMDTTECPSSGDQPTDSEVAGSNPTTGDRVSHGNWSPAATGATRSETGKAFTDQDLVALLSSVQETVRLSEATLTDAEFMFQDRPAPIDDATIINSILLRRAGGNPNVVVKTEPAASKNTRPAGKGKGQDSAGLNEEEAKALAAPFLTLSRANEHEWSAYMDSLFDGLFSQGIVTRKGKKKGPEFLPVSVDPRLRTPRGVSLLLSPLSQFEDRMVGLLHCDTIYQAQTSGEEMLYTSTVQVPASLRKAEDDAIDRCSLQSAAAIADLQIRRLKTSLKEITKFSQEAYSSLRRAESHHEVATVEESLELRKMYKELVHYGIVPPGADDPPLSPITSNSASVAASLLQSSVYANGANNKQNSKNSRAPVRNVSVASRMPMMPMQAPIAAALAPVDTAVVSVPVRRVDSNASECGGTTSESVSGSDGKSAEENALEAGETLKRKASSGSVASSAGVKRRR